MPATTCYFLVVHASSRMCIYVVTWLSERASGVRAVVLHDPPSRSNLPCDPCFIIHTSDASRHMVIELCYCLCSTTCLLSARLSALTP
mmetsp:Transcript_3407/g.10196  ORF Transcript_3407/g.10196 Transcript_3407/m.10196 type:complete len:88 (+) Transcript_3407:812-1075(+)